VLERFHQLWAPRFCQSELGSKKLPFGRNGCSLYRSSCQQRQLHQQPLQIQCYYHESKNLLDRSATNSNQGCFAACASMIKKVGRQNCERETTMITKKQDKTTCPGCWSEHNWSTNQSKNQIQSWQWFCWMNVKRKSTTDWTNNLQWGKPIFFHWKKEMKKKKYQMMEGWRQWFY